jgi:hypothetical protein
MNLHFGRVLLLKTTHLYPRLEDAFSSFFSPKATTQGTLCRYTILRPIASQAVTIPPEQIHLLGEPLWLSGKVRK